MEDAWASMSLYNNSAESPCLRQKRLVTLVQGLALILKFVMSFNGRTSWF